MEPTVANGVTEKLDGKTARQDRRLRAVYRRELQDSIRFSALAAAAGTTLTCIVAGLLAPSAAAVEIVIAALIGLSCVGVAREIPHHCRRYVVQLGMLVGLLPMVSTAALAILVPQSQPVVLGSVALAPIGFAVFIPLQRRAHLTWLVAANVIFLVPIFAFSAVMPWDAELPALTFACLTASVVSLGANEVQLRRRQQMDSQLLAVRGLYARMKDHEQDLRRQDEFLFMQQETLVVQQAELLRLNEELETIARLDALTGLGNRLRLNEDLAQAAARIERTGGTVGLLLMDLDRFKRLNDSAGHLAGDKALRGVADVLRKTSRLGDGVYRYGGEEFLVLLHDCDDVALEAAGQRYITAIAAAGMAHPDNPPWNLVTASAGARELSVLNCHDVDSALHDADEALYVAKASGRNRIEVHHAPNSGTVVPLDRQRAAS
jgi:diguanylate cyclase (GGDEF)-like protein